MSAKTITTRIFVCDHCGAQETFEYDCDAGRAGWALLNINGKEYAVCRDDYLFLKLFLNINFKPVRPL